MMPQFFLGRGIFSQSPRHLAGQSANDHEGIFDFMADVGGGFTHRGETLGMHQAILGLYELPGLELHLAARVIVKKPGRRR